MNDASTANAGELVAAIFVLALIILAIVAVVILFIKFWRMDRAKQQRVNGWIFAALVLLILSTCIDWTDIDILEVIKRDEPAPIVMRVSVGPSLTDEKITEGAKQKCRDLIVLPPSEAVATINRPYVRPGAEPTGGREEMNIVCSRP